MRVVLAQVAFAKEDRLVIANGSNVEFEYTLSLANGSLVQSNAGGTPLNYVHGEGGLPRALQAAFAGHTENDEFEVRLSPKEGWGTVKADLFRDVPIKQIPEYARKVGAKLRAPGINGTFRVHQVYDETVVLDFNHPLAGEELHFTIRIVSVKSASAGR